MECPNCHARTVVFDVPSEYREHVPEEAERAALCPECLTLVATDAPPEPRFDRISSAFPENEAAAVPLAIGIGLLDSLALHRRSLEALVPAAEAAGADPLLLLDRLHVQGGVDPSFDISRRRHQLEQLLESVTHD
ncbi:MAG: DUF6276 family protein [Natronomonas sp.]|jgi:hypothetical protein|uniref:DUF6276 family protein n=1 Tax=Natronomonas sp. TaxID=2184060 RepID=UPI00286FD6F2|nr:DUF6276 family protein [Natronomonas sp.]MDR9381003.1 DUF6276 family protein [Natronomonas sp.]MDR9431833.1 DUF6276 family protein [Natronomonas sp.]